MLIIRLQRTGKKSQPEFRIVLAEKYRHASKKFLEILGNYNPRNKNFSVKNQEKLDYWLGKNVEVSATVHNLFVDHDIIKGAAKVKAFTTPKKEQAAEVAEAPAEAEVASEAAQTEAPAETVAEEVVAEAPAAEAAPEAAAEEPAAEAVAEAPEENKEA